MTEKEYTVHKMIEGCNVASDCIDSYVKELIERNEFVEDVTVEIFHNGKEMTYKECCETLNQLTEENKYLREKMNEKIKDETSLGLTYNDITNLRFLNSIIKDQREQIKELHKENSRLINENTTLKYTPQKDYNKKEIQDALMDVHKNYHSIEKMSFHDLILIENLILNFEKLLFKK